MHYPAETTASRPHAAEACDAAEAATPAIQDTGQYGSQGDADTCMLCLDAVCGPAVTLLCGHHLHTECILRWMQTTSRPYNEVCPFKCWRMD